MYRCSTMHTRCDCLNQLLPISVNDTAPSLRAAAVKRGSGEMESSLSLTAPARRARTTVWRLRETLAIMAHQETDAPQEEDEARQVPRAGHLIGGSRARVPAVRRLHSARRGRCVLPRGHRQKL